GLEAVMSLAYIPGTKFKGSIAYVYPYLDSKTRTVRVRLEFDNGDGKLRPGMYANIVIKTRDRKKAVVIPKESVIHSGERDIVFIDIGEGKYEPREITLGAEGEGGYYEVLEGLTGSELVVTSGQFMLDSESSLREAVRKRLRARKASMNSSKMKE
ncbi:MAG: efflux RND transporter periplasmic adaptor subunit, partial [Candidatus Marinimicrobia bacterium]|nr:efflux RND transporter periplasmic adaptor subunit [Candidatus Neomarinimicrobiota bacterium]